MCFFFRANVFQGVKTADVLAGHSPGRRRHRRSGGGVAPVLSRNEALAHRQTPFKAAKTNVNVLFEFTINKKSSSSFFIPVTQIVRR